MTSTTTPENCGSPKGRSFLSIPRRTAVELFRLTTVAVVFTVTVPLQASLKPNIIVIYTDDHGYADIGVQGVLQDVRTPHIDELARSGAVAANGYSTAPQCVPSRAGLLTGKFQGRFNLDNNRSALDGFNRQTTIAKRLQQAGYVTAQFGKWHLGPAEEIVRHGFTHVFSQNAQRAFSANVNLDGSDRPMGTLSPTMYHVDGCSRAAASIIERYRERPFFLYVAYRAPHTPLDAPEKYTRRFPGEMPERRRQALAMISAVDDGVGLITSTLQKHGLTQRTLIFLIGDNGAPLKIHKTDSPLDGDAGGWDGSLNTPLNGEKGMLTEGGINVPFVIAWPGVISGGQRYRHPVSALDVAATAAAIAEAPIAPGDLDGVNLVPHLNGQKDSPPHARLFWRWSAQSAIREGDWKLLRGGDREYLFNLGDDREEKHNLVPQHPEIAARLRTRLKDWSDELDPPGLALQPMAKAWTDYFNFYLDGKPVEPPSAGVPTSVGSQSLLPGWMARNATLVEKDGVLIFRGENQKPGFITRSSLQIPCPASLRLTIKTAAGGKAAVTWRMEGDKDFVPANRQELTIAGSSDWQALDVPLAPMGRIIHLRVYLPSECQVKDIKTRP